MNNRVLCLTHDYVMFGSSHCHHDCFCSDTFEHMIEGNPNLLSYPPLTYSIGFAVSNNKARTESTDPRPTDMLCLDIEHQL